MHQQELVRYLTTTENTEDFILSLQSEISIYRRALAKNGSSIPILYEGDTQRILIGNKEIKKLCTDFRVGLIDQYFMGYVADALLLSENSIFENEEIQDRFELMSELVDQDAERQVFIDFLCK
jgi:hypothetical protein